MVTQGSARLHGVSWHLAAFALLIASAPPALAQNTVLNPNFATDLAPWALFVSAPPDPIGSGSATWTAAQDAGNAIGVSGAARVGLDATPTGAHAAAGIRQCVAFAQPTNVMQANYGARFKIPASDVRTSEYCRAREYARLLFDRDAEVEPGLVPGEQAG